MCPETVLSISHVLFYLILPKHRCSGPYYNLTHFTEPSTKDCQRGDLRAPLYNLKSRAPTSSLSLDHINYTLMCFFYHPTTSLCGAAACLQPRQRAGFILSSIEKVPIPLPVSGGNEHAPSPQFIMKGSSLSHGPAIRHSKIHQGRHYQSKASGQKEKQQNKAT